MEHHYLTRHAVITWLAIERGEGLSSADLVDSAFTSDWLEESAETVLARHDLEQLSEDQIFALFNDRMEYHRARLLQARENIEAGLFLNKPAAFADYGYWARQLLWTVEDAVCLSLGRNPDVLNEAQIEAAGPTAKSSTLAKEYFARCRIASSWIRAGQLYAEGTPGDMLAWLNRAKLSYAPELAHAVEEMGHQIADWKVLYDRTVEDLAHVRSENEQLREALARWQEYAAQLETQGDGEKAELERKVQELLTANKLLVNSASAPATGNEMEEQETIDPRIRTTLYSLINVMSVEKYRYNPKEAKSAAPGNIVDAVLRQGLEYSDKTVRKHLRVAAEIAEAERQKRKLKRK